jgi:hypothetical protein
MISAPVFKCIHLLLVDTANGVRPKPSDQANSHSLCGPQLVPSGEREIEK